MIGCRICQGKPKRGTRCMFCGLKLEAAKSQKQKKTVEQAAAEEAAKFKQKCFEDELKYLGQTRDKLLKFNMMTTGSEDLDRIIIHYLGDWLDGAGREAVGIVCAALKMQLDQGVTPTKARTLEIAIAAGLRRSTREALYRAVHSYQYEEDDATRLELAARR